MMYAQEYMAEQTFQPQLVIYMSSIYTDAELLFSEVSDDSKVRDIIYGNVEEIKNLMKNPSQAIMRTPVYRDIESNLTTVQQLMNNYISTFLAGWNSNVSGNFIKIADIKFAVELVVVLLLIKILVSGYLNKLRTKTKRSISTNYPYLRHGYDDTSKRCHEKRSHYGTVMMLYTLLVYIPSVIYLMFTIILCK